jgi:hypothetical protein
MRRPSIAFRSLRAVAVVVIISLIGMHHGHADEVERNAMAAALMAAYPDKIVFVDRDEIYWLDGAVSPLGQVRAPEILSAIPDDASLAEQFFYRYAPLDWTPFRPSLDDPGRLRNEAFFLKMYGDCRTEQRLSLRAVKWLRNSGSSLQITTENHLDRIVERLSNDIDRLAPELKSAAMRPAGGFACRTVAGRRSLSMHAFGAAIDLDPHAGCYWRWSGQLASLQCVQSIPRQLIELFEKYGFIWGGNWLHIDTMHFEYRPELIEYSRKIAARANKTP